MKLDFLALPESERRLYIEQAAIQRSLSPVILEKDFWVWARATINYRIGRDDFRLAPGARRSRCQSIIDDKRRRAKRKAAGFREV